MNQIAITIADISEADALAAVIACAFADVATRFGVTRENCPGHTSFVDGDEVRRGMGFGNRYFKALSDHLLCGTVAVRPPKNGVAILEKLAVLPAFRHHGLGRRLVEHASQDAKRDGATTLEIGIIAEHAELRAWYERNGFRIVRRAHYEHLPFDVLHLQRML